MRGSVRFVVLIFWVTDSPSIRNGYGAKLIQDLRISLFFDDHIKAHYHITQRNVN